MFIFDIAGIYEEYEASIWLGIYGVLLLLYTLYVIQDNSHIEIFKKKKRKKQLEKNWNFGPKGWRWKKKKKKCEELTV